MVCLIYFYLNLVRAITDISKTSVSAVKKYRYALSLVEEGVSKWRDLPLEKKGTTFTTTFRRGVQVGLMRTYFYHIVTTEDESELFPLSVALEEGWSNAKTAEDKEPFSFDEIQAHAEELLDVSVSESLTFQHH